MQRKVKTTRTSRHVSTVTSVCRRRRIRQCLNAPLTVTVCLCDCRLNTLLSVCLPPCVSAVSVSTRQACRGQQIKRSLLYRSSSEEEEEEEVRLIHCTAEAKCPPKSRLVLTETFRGAGGWGGRTNGVGAARDCGIRRRRGGGLRLQVGGDSSGRLFPLSLVAYHHRFTLWMQITRLMDN